MTITKLSKNVYEVWDGSEWKDWFTSLEKAQNHYPEAEYIVS